MYIKKKYLYSHIYIYICMCVYIYIYINTAFIEKALRLGAADLSGLEAQSTSHEYESLRETIPKRHRTTSIRKGSEQSMNESRIQE